MSSGLHAGRGAMTRVTRGGVRWAGLIRSPAAPWLALAVLVIGTGGLLLHETRGTTLWFDEWTWLLHRRGDSVSTFLGSHDGHLSLIPIAIYRLLFATAGVRQSGAYRAVMIAEHLLVCVLLFVYARRRVGPVPALAATALLLLFGPGWENLLWAFQITWLTSLAAGLGALLALDRRDRAGDVAACILLLVALASSGLGVPIVIGVVLEVLLARRPLRQSWVVLVPIAAYAIWAVGYQHTVIVRHAFVAGPGFVATGLASTFAGLAGLGGSTGQDGQGTLMTWGPVLLVAALGAAGWRVARLRRLEPRVAALAAMLLSFWVITALTRAVFANPYSSRYLYVSALFAVLVAVELGRGVALRWWVQGVVAVLAAGAIVSNFGALRDAARLLRDDGVITKADLGALEIARPLVPAGYLVAGLPGVPFVQVYAGQYFAAERSVGTPAQTPAQIAADPEPAREIADTELIHIHRLSLQPAGRTGLVASAPPTVDSATAGSTAVRGGCVAFTAARYTPAGVSPALALAVPPAGLRLQATGVPATVGVRRFADAFHTLGSLGPGGPVRLVIAPDRSGRPWHVRVATAGGAIACGLG